MIYYFTPYSIDKNLGRAYNAHCALVPNDDDWICLTDGDTMFLTPDYGAQIEDIIKQYHYIGLFTCLTNRIGNVQQQFNQQISEIDSILHHRAIATNLRDNYYGQVEPLRRFISGHLMLFKKKVWRQVGGFPDGLLKIDNRFSSRILRSGMSVMLMKGLYIFHYYRLHSGKHDKSHLR